MPNYAEDVNYWKTSKSSPSTWIDCAKREIERVGGSILSEAFAMQDGQSAYLLEFELEGARFRILWHVLESKTGDTSAAKRQAATALYHDVKASCVKVRFAGARRAFADALVVENRTVGELIDRDLAQALPKLLRPALPSPDDGVIDGDVREIE